MPITYIYLVASNGEQYQVNAKLLTDNSEVALKQYNDKKNLVMMDKMTINVASNMETVKLAIGFLLNKTFTGIVENNLKNLIKFCIELKIKSLADTLYLAICKNITNLMESDDINDNFHMFNDLLYMLDIEKGNAIRNLTYQWSSVNLISRIKNIVKFKTINLLYSDKPNTYIKVALQWVLERRQMSDIKEDMIDILNVINNGEFLLNTSYISYIGILGLLTSCTKLTFDAEVIKIIDEINKHITSTHQQVVRAVKMLEDSVNVNKSKEEKNQPDVKKRKSDS